MADSGTSRASAGQHLRLLAGFEYRNGTQEVVVPQSAQRLLAYLAVEEHRVTRSSAAEVLWPRSTEAASLASLRSALHRARAILPWSITGSDRDLMLSPLITVDVVERRRLIRRLARAPDTVDLPELESADLHSEILPGWNDDWLEPMRRREAELIRHARDCLAERLLAEGRFAEAIDAALAAIAHDPYGELPYRVVAGAHLRQGNPAAAALVFENYRRLVGDELGVRPSDQFRSLVTEVHLDRWADHTHPGRRRLSG